MTMVPPNPQALPLLTTPSLLACFCFQSLPPGGLWPELSFTLHPLPCLTSWLTGITISPSPWFPQRPLFLSLPVATLHLGELPCGLPLGMLVAFKSLLGRELFQFSCSCFWPVDLTCEGLLYVTEFTQTCPGLRNGRFLLLRAPGW